MGERRKVGRPKLESGTGKEHRTSFRYGNDIKWILDSLQKEKGLSHAEVITKSLKYYYSALMKGGECDE